MSAYPHFLGLQKWVYFHRFTDSGQAICEDQYGEVFFADPKRGFNFLDAKPEKITHRLHNAIVNIKKYLKKGKL
jgi:hypothetical protein